MSWIEIPCPICGSEEKTEWFGFPEDRFERFIYWQKCAYCGCLYQSPRMSNKTLEDFYIDGYRTATHGQEEPAMPNVFTEQLRASVVVEWLQERVEKVDRHLDIGCSSGALMIAMREVYGCETFGVELSKEYLSMCEEQELAVSTDLPEQSFDLITMVHVLEHLPDPIDYLKTLPETEYLFVEVPNGEAYDAAFNVFHLVAYYEEHLYDVLKAADFDIVEAEKHSRPFNDPTLRNISMLARKA